MKRIFTAAAIASILLASALGYAGFEATGIKVYTGDNGLEVAMVQLKEPGKYLIRVTDSLSTLDNLVLAYEINTSSGIPGLTTYRTKWRGDDYNFVHFETPRSGGPGRLILYSTNNVGNGLNLTLSEARSRQVKPGDLISRHEQQLKDGTIARFQRFDRLAEQASREKDLAEDARKANKACGTKVPVKIVWSTISDEQMRSYSISGYCNGPFSAMEQLCESAEARKFLQARLKQVVCQFGKEMKIELDPQGVLAWTTSEHPVNVAEFARKYWEDAVVPSEGATPPAPTGKEVPPWGQVKTLGERILLEKTAVCTDGKSSYVALAPDSQRIYKLYFGNDKTLWRVPPTGMSSGWFFDPRAYNPTANPNFRGADVRTLSEVQLDTEKKTCSVRCGVHTTPLQLMDGKAAGELLRRVAIEAPLHKRRPHVLTRDEKGTYYYVDRGNTPETEKNFRLFVGPTGNLKLKAMTNIVADSNGEIFSTKSGSLRFITGPGGQDSAWIQGKKVTKLIPVPVDKNFGLIYNELGPYTGERLGTPCDVW